MYYICIELIFILFIFSFQLILTNWIILSGFITNCTHLLIFCLFLTLLFWGILLTSIKKNVRYFWKGIIKIRRNNNDWRIILPFFEFFVFIITWFYEVLSAFCHRTNLYYSFITYFTCISVYLFIVISMHHDISIDLQFSSEIVLYRREVMFRLYLVGFLID